MGHGYTTRGGWFIDPQGRHTLLRGVNLGGSSKVPYWPNGATHLGVGHARWREVSFVGRPAPLDELDRHLERIRHWGFNVLRLLTTWEAIEHAGPRTYDEAYLDYLTEVVRRAGHHGLLVFIDPHQDCWSRFTGGDGAPRWTFELAGLLPERFVEADQAEINAFDWPANNQRVPAATMWTLFFAGDLLCPELTGVQEELQRHYLGAMTSVAERLAAFDHVLGYDTLNEPSAGYLGRGRHLTRGMRFMSRGDDDGFPPWTPLEYLAAADGERVHRDRRTLNHERIRVWRDGCPWRRLGVWDLDGNGRPVVARPDWFDERDGRALDPWRDAIEPFVRRFRDAVRTVHPDAFVFIEGEPLARELAWDDPDPLVVNARHWYDVMTLITRRFDPDAYRSLGGQVLQGVDEIAAEFTEQLRAFADHSRDHMGGAPLLLGEFGIPYEMNRGVAYRTSDWSAQQAALEANYRAIDAVLAHSTQWNYTADNTHANGDQWNEEDLSIFSVDDQRDPADLDSGGRAVAGFCRPHVLHAVGRPSRQLFDGATGRFELVLEPGDPSHPVGAGAATEVFLPAVHYPDGPIVTVDDGVVEGPGEHQIWRWRHTTTTPVTMTVTRGVRPF